MARWKKSKVNKETITTKIEERNKLIELKKQYEAETHKLE